MKILHVVPSYIPAWRYGGPIRSVHGICRGLARAGHEVHVFTTNVDGPDSLPVPLGQPVDIDGVTVWYFASKWFRRLYYSRAMGAALRARIGEFDVVHLHSIYLWPTTAAAAAARRAHIPYVLAPRGMLVAEFIRRKNRWIKRLWIRSFEVRNIQGAALVQFTSVREKNEAIQLGLPFAATVIVPNGVDEDDLALPDMAVLESGIDEVLPPGFLLYVGRLSWEKGLDRLIDALQYVPEVSLLIAGNDEANYKSVLEAAARKAGVGDRVKFLGAVNKLRKQRLMRKAAILILPSYSENFGNVVLEAMAMACPVVVTPEVGAAPLVLEANAGFVIEGQPRTFGLAIAELLLDRVALKDAGTRGRQAVLSHYNWDTVARKMEAAYLAVEMPRHTLG